MLTITARHSNTHHKSKSSITNARIIKKAADWPSNLQIRYLFIEYIYAPIDESLDDFVFELPTLESHFECSDVGDMN